MNNAPESGNGDEGLVIRARNLYEKTDAAKYVANLPFVPRANTITTRLRTSAAALGLIAEASLPAPLNRLISTACYTANLIGDGLDGFVARMQNDCTEEGQRLDSLVDKLSNHAYLVYLVIHDITMQVQQLQLDAVVGFDDAAEAAFVAGACVNVATDIYSTMQRGSVSEQFEELGRVVRDPASGTPVDPTKPNTTAANNSGKMKMILQSLSILAKLVGGENPYVTAGAAAGLMTAAVYGVSGVLQRKGSSLMEQIKSLMKR